jgi:hypothetical protein
METYKIIKKFLTEGGRCILIENDKPIGVVLTIEEYEKLVPKLSISETDKTSLPDFTEPASNNPIGEAMAKEMNFPEASAEIADIESANDVTLEDLGVDELPY